VAKTGSPAAREAAFVSQITDRAVKVTFPTCLHQCRGNYAPRCISPHDHLGELGEAFFSLPFDRFTLEWDGHVERGDSDCAALGGRAVAKARAAGSLGGEDLGLTAIVTAVAPPPPCGTAGPAPPCSTP
jgi:hypothetical protein